MTQAPDERRSRLQVGDPGQCRSEALAFGLILGDGHRAFSPFDAGGGIPDMLIENLERAAIGRLLFGGIHSAAHQSPRRDLIMAEELRYERRSVNIAILNIVQDLFERRSKLR